jgi:8-oxo-dGTP diphosphatase
MLTVVAAIIESQGKLLVCQRRRGDAFGLMWEFPGGKVKAGENPEKALERELLEELGAAARIGPEVYRTLHKYAEMGEPIELIFFVASLEPSKAKNLAFEQFLWLEPKALRVLSFLPADQEFVEKLATNALRLPQVRRDIGNREQC